MLPFCWIRRKNWKTEKGKQTNLERKCNGHAHNEQEEWHYKVSKVAAIPWRMPNHRPLSTSIVNQNHQLHHQEENYAKSKIHKRQQKSRFLPTRTSKKLFLFTVLWHWIEVTKVNYRANLFELPKQWGHERCRGKRRVSAWKACGPKYRVPTRWDGGGEWPYRLWFRPFCDVNGVWALMMKVSYSVQLKAKLSYL